MKFRLIVTKHEHSPYCVQRKENWYSFWVTLKMSSYRDTAEAYLKEQVKEYMSRPKPGVIKLYEEADMLVDKLKGEI